MSSLVPITQTCPCNILQYFMAVKMISEAVLTSTHNLCFGAKIRKLYIPLKTPLFLYKSGV